MLPDINEALRYLGAGSRPPEELRQQAAQVAEELAAQVQPRCTYRLFPLVREEGSFRLDGTNLLLSGHTAKRMLPQSLKPSGTGRPSAEAAAHSPLPLRLARSDLPLK